MAVRKIELMHQIFGKAEFGTCSACGHYRRYTYNGKPYRKCSIYGLSHSEATDWTGKWEACRLFPDKKTKQRDIVKLVKKEKKEEPIDGQLSLF